MNMKSYPYGPTVLPPNPLLEPIRDRRGYLGTARFCQNPYGKPAKALVGYAPGSTATRPRQEAFQIVDRIL
jgi:hypothetical protein